MDTHEVDDLRFRTLRCNESASALWPTQILVPILTAFKVRLWGQNKVEPPFQSFECRI
jgi:hypothetical protein